MKRANPWPRRFWPFYSLFPVGPGLDDILRDARKPFLTLAGVLGGGGVLGSLRYWETIRPVFEDLGFTEWFRHEAVLLFDLAVLSVLAFLILTLMLIRLLDGYWMFSIARNMVVTAVFCFVVLVFRLFPERAFAGFGLSALSLALLLSYLGSPYCFLKGYWRVRSYGDWVLELVLLAPFLGFLWPVYTATAQVRMAWDACLVLGRAVVGDVP